MHWQVLAPEFRESFLRTDLSDAFELLQLGSYLACSLDPRGS